MAEINNLASFIQVQLGRNQTNTMSSLILITRSIVERMQSERAEQVVDFDSYEIVAAKREQARLINFKNKVTDSAILLSKASLAISNASIYLTQMKNDLMTLDSSSTAAERTAAAEAFDAKIAKIEGEMSGANHTVAYNSLNLVGNTNGPDFETDSLSTAFSIKSGVFNVQGVYLGSDYVIEDADGLIWRRDSAAGKFVQYAADGYTPTGSEVATEGLTVDSYDESTGAVTFGGSGALTGTVQRGGLGILGSEFYADFGDDAAIARAIADIDSAISYVTANGATIKSKHALIDGNLDMAQVKYDNLAKEVSSLIETQIDENAALDKAANLRLMLVINNLNLVSSASTGLIENMVQLASGPGKADGIFGILGY